MDKVIKKRLRFEELTKENIRVAAKVQYEIFPDSCGYSTYKKKVTGKMDHFYVSYLAYLKDKPIGVIGLYEIPEYSDTIWLSWFGLLKEYRNMGFGKELLEFIIEVAKANHKKFLRLYTSEVYNKEAQKFYERNMEIGEYYFNEEEKVKEIFQGKQKIFGISLCDEKIKPWNNQFINISGDEEGHEESILMMKQDGILES